MVKIDRSDPRWWRTLFGAYGYEPQKSTFGEAGGLRFWLPGDVPGTAQTGVYSYFAVAGDCEASCAYELLNLPAPKTGYGSGVGLAFDIEGGGRGSIQRVSKPDKGSCYVLQVVPGGGKKGEADRIIPVTSRNALRFGRIGLRREQKDLIFLAAEGPTGELEEIGRMEFTNRTIKPVRFFADPGNSPTALDIRLRDIDVRAEEVASGVPVLQVEPSSWWWLWTLLGIAAAGLVLWLGWKIRLKRNAEAMVE
jgi:hypothetical protein